MKQLTNEEYVASKGIRCPYCGSRSLEGDCVEVDAGYAEQKLGCFDCEKEWVDVYTLTGFRLIN